jgi:hypothetical protein
MSGEIAADFATQRWDLRFCADLWPKLLAKLDGVTRVRTAADCAPGAVRLGFWMSLRQVHACDARAKSARKLPG